MGRPCTLIQATLKLLGESIGESHYVPHRSSFGLSYLRATEAAFGPSANEYERAKALGAASLVKGCCYLHVRCTEYILVVWKN